MSEGGLGRQLALGAATICGLAVLCAGAASAGIASIFGGGSPPSATATGSIPTAMLALYQQAALTCPGLPWTILAAVGTIESDNDQSTLPGVHSGLNAAGLAADIWTWDWSIREVRDEGRWPRACGVSAVCEARLARGGRHTGFVACGADGWRVSGVAGGVAE